MIKGNRVIAKTSIEDPDWKGRGLAEVGSKGIILGKKKGLYAVKWDSGTTTWKVLPESIREDIKPESIIRRDFWKTYEGSALANEETFKPGSKGDCFGNAKTWAVKNDDGKTFVVHGKITNAEGKTFDHAWVEQGDKVIDPTQGIKLDKERWYRAVHAIPEAKYTPHQTMINMVRSGKLGPWFPHEVEGRFVWRKDKLNESIEEALGKKYSKMTRKDEQEALQIVIAGMNKEGRLGHDFKKVATLDRATTDYPGRVLMADLRYYEYTGYDDKPRILVLRKRADGMSYGLFQKGEVDVPGPLAWPFQTWHKFYPISNIIKRLDTLKEGRVWKFQNTNYVPISRKDEQEAIAKLKYFHPLFRMTDADKTLKKIKHVQRKEVGGKYLDEIEYKATHDEFVYFIELTKLDEGMIYKISLYENDKHGNMVFKNRQEWDFVHTPKLSPGELIYESADAGSYHGKRGAGAIILAKDTGRILLPLRSDTVQQPNTWGTWGGAIEGGEDPASAMKREITEELGGNIKIDELIPLYVYNDPQAGFQFYNFLVIVPAEFIPKLNHETKRAEWVKYGVWPHPIHFGLKILLDRSGEVIKNEVKKYMKDPASIKTQKMDRLKFKAAHDLIRKVWYNMARGDALNDQRNRFDYDDVSMWLLNEHPTQELLDYYGHQFYPFEHEPAYKFLEDVERALEELELRYNRRLSRYIDPSDPLYVLKRLVKGKSWERAKYDLAKFTLSGPIVPVGERISDESAEGMFDVLYRIAMGETRYDADKFGNVPRLDTLERPNSDEAVENFLRYYLPTNVKKFPVAVKIYRGTNSPLSKVRPGEFCSFDKDYVRYYIRGKYGAVIRDTLPTHDLLLYKLDPGNSEMIYWPEGHQIQKYSGEIPKFKDFFLQNR